MEVQEGKSNPTGSVFLGFDPGKDKCGVAVVQTAPSTHPPSAHPSKTCPSNLSSFAPLSSNPLIHILEHEVVASADAINRIQSHLQSFEIHTLIIGNQTTSKQWQQRLREGLRQRPNIIPVDERNTTLLARDRYWQMFPPQGFQRLIPQGMRQPPRPIDDIVAILLVERFLNNQSLNR